MCIYYVYALFVCILQFSEGLLFVRVFVNVCSRRKAAKAQLMPRKTIQPSGQTLLVKVTWNDSKGHFKQIIFKHE